MAAADNEPTEATIAETRPSDDTPIGTAGVPTTPVREYQKFSGLATGGEVPPPMGRDHAYTAEGIRKLDAALASLVEQKHDSDARAPLRERHLFVPTEALAIGERERELKRITLPLTPESAERAADTAD